MRDVAADSSFDDQIDGFVARTRALTGQVISERPQWNTVASADAIRHFCTGVGDDNPRWDVEAPPMFLASVLYPMLHGAPMVAPLSNLIGRLAFTWERPIPMGSKIGATARQVNVNESRDRDGRRLVLVDAEIDYTSPDGVIFGTAHGTMVRIAQDGAPLLLEREPSRYADEEIERFQQEILATSRRDEEPFHEAELAVGASLPRLLIGPLTIGDLVCWQAAIGPSYRAGPLGLRDALQAPHTAVIAPTIGWPVKYSQQHEDTNLTSQRGMPAPFDNGAMRMSQMSRQLTDWMGPAGRLTSLELQMTAPVLYGDVTWFDATITASEAVESGRRQAISIVGTNQLGEMNTQGTATVIVASSQIHAKADHRLALAPRQSTPIAAADCPDVVDAVLAHASGDPDRPAVRGADGALTFGELSTHAGGLAEALRSLGIGAGDVVVMAINRSATLPAHALGVLMSGAAYCPVEAGMPQRRLESLLAAAGPGAVVASSAVAAELGLGDLPVIDPAAVEPRPGLSTPGRGGDPAYVIQTSGSQGSAKTVAVSRRTLARYVAALRTAIDVSPDDRYLLTASMLFSASSRQLWFPLSVGAELVIADETEVADPAGLLAAMGRSATTVWDTTPTFWGRVCTAVEALSDAERAALLPGGLRLVLSTGEPLPWSTIRRWRTLAGTDQTLINLYSQTETAGTACIHIVPVVPTDEVHVPLGLPMADIDVHLLETPTGAGSDREIVIESDRLATGYIDDAELTSQRFLDIDGRLLYRTGDIGHRRPDGTLEIRGRADARLKIRGFRVDPTEVEAALERLPAIERAAVTARASRGGGESLVAQLELAAEAPDPATIRAALAHDLPDYAIPTSYEIIDQLPTTYTGKLDRSRLGALVGRLLGPTAEHRAPTTPEEQVLVELVGEVIGIGAVGVDDDFIDLGGHSLAAIDLAARIQSTLGVSLSVAAIFDNPTPAELAELVEVALVDGPSPNIAVIDRSGPIAASPMQEALFVLSELHPGDPFNNIDWGVDIRGHLDVDALRRAFSGLARRHEALRTRFDFAGNDLQQVIEAPAPVDMELVDLVDIPAGERRRVALEIAVEYAGRGFDLRRGPVWRAKLVREQPDRHVLVLVAHHSIVDMYSVAIMIRDLLALYDAERRGEPDELPPIGAQLVDFVAWQRQLSGTSDHADSLATRAEALSDAQPIDLRGDLTPPAHRSHEVVQVTGAVSPETTANLRVYARDRKVTLFVAALAAFKACLRTRSDQQDLVVGCPFARRDRPELQDTVGMLVNTLPIRTDLTEAGDLHDVVTAVKRSTRQAFAAVDLPYADLVAAVHDGKRPGNELIEILFQLQEDPLAGIGLDDLEVERIPLDPGTGAFPLQVSVRDRGDDLHVTMEVTADLFSEDHAQGMLKGYVIALESIAALVTP